MKHFGTKTMTTTSSNRRIALALFAACIITGLATMGHAETAVDPTSDSGTSNIQMHGPEFVGVKLDAARGGMTLIRVTAFRGEYLDARVARSRDRWTRRVLHATDLIGVHWVERWCTEDGRCENTIYRITGAARDTATNTMPQHSDNRDVWLYDVEATDAARPTEADWRAVCDPDAHGLTQGLFLTGDFHADGSMSNRGYTFSCTAGVIAKCVRDWGYKPWKSLVSGRGERVDMRPLHRACTRAVRADYCGDGISYTRDGTMIDVFDRYGFNVRESGGGFVAEAGFSPTGATWVSRTRWPIGARVAEEMMRLPQCARPTSTPKEPLPSLITVWSLPRERTATVTSGS